MTVRTKPAPASAATKSADADRSASFSWSDWFGHASAPQRAAALTLARQQGVLYSHQLPAIKNGAKPATAPLKEPEPFPAITRLLAGKIEHLCPVPFTPINVFDQDLDDLQREAVRRALAVPDLFLLQGLPGTGKSRVVVEIVRQSVQLGWRVLFVAERTVSLDIVLERLADRPEILALRHLDMSENAAALPPAVRRFGLDACQQSFTEELLASAVARQAQAEAACRRRKEQEPLWTELHASAVRVGEWHERQQAVAAQLGRIEEAVVGDSQAGGNAPWQMRLGHLQQTTQRLLDALAADIDLQRESLRLCEEKLAELAQRINALEPAYRARKQGRFWTLAFWTNLFNGSIIADLEAGVVAQTEAIAESRAASQRLEGLLEQQRSQKIQAEADQRALLAGEQAARRQVLEGHQHDLAEQRRRLDDEWNTLCARLDVRRAELTPASVAEAQQKWQVDRTHDEQQCQFTQGWTHFAQESAANLAGKLPSYANVIAVSLAGWLTDSKLRDGAGGPFDLVIVEDAESLTEAELLKLSRHAARCVLVANVLAERTPAPTIDEKASRALLPPALAPSACWDKLWQTLAGEMDSWPASWRRDQDRLVCQLVSLTNADEQHLESEGLADAADIELRILQRPGERPALAQVRFAPTVPFADAFAFMVREVQEFPLESAGRSGWWTEDESHVCRCLAPHTPSVQAWLDVEPGARLGLVANQEGEATRTACIEFDKSAGWNRPAAAAWLRRQRALPDLERTIFLQVPYRLHGPLATLVQTVVRAGEWIAPESETEHATFEFIPVPPIKREWPIDGAGLELDLSAPRHADRLPAGVRQDLPSRGYVNYLEAQSLIRRLEAWSQQESKPAERVCVLALYEGQVALLRRLLEQSEILRGRGSALEVALPSQLHQRECDVALVSLTRSHAHRSVVFGEDIQELPLALTRARRSLLVFGDPGTLSKRSTGPHESAETSAAHTEYLRISRLVAFLRRQVDHPQVECAAPSSAPITRSCAAVGV